MVFAKTLALALCLLETRGMSTKHKKKPTISAPPPRFIPIDDADVWSSPPVAAVKAAPEATSLVATPHATHPNPILVLRLAHSGSSWFTQMLSEQPDTFIAREGIYKFAGEEEKKVRAMSVDQIAQYVLRTLAVPMGSIVKPSFFKTYTYACLNETGSDHGSDHGSGHVSLASHAQQYVNPAVNKCIKEQGHECPLKFVGSTIDPIGTGLDKYGDEVFRRVAKAHPNLPVIIYRRSNLVKHAMARGGICGKDMAELNQHQNVSEFMSKVMEAVEHDKALMHAASFFSNKKIVTYEDLQAHPFDTMNGVLRFLHMPTEVTPEQVGRGVQETPEDLRKLFSNFEELDRALSARSPCLAQQLRVDTHKAFYTPCPMGPAAPATPKAPSGSAPVSETRVLPWMMP